MIEKQTDYAGYKTCVKKYTSLELVRDHGLTAYHLREEAGRGLMLAEGEDDPFAIGGVPLKIYGTFSSYAAVAENSGERRFTASFAPQGFAIDILPNFMLELRDAEGENRYFGVTDSAIYEITPTGYALVTDQVGGSCGAAMGERLFVANGDRLYYSAPLDGGDWSQERGKGGWFDLPSAYGGIVALVPYKDALYLFRERGEITKFVMRGDDLNAKSSSLPALFHDVLPNTCDVCGDRIFFFTDAGLCAFDGRECRVIETKHASSFASSGAVGIGLKGRYYLYAPSISPYLYCYNTLTGFANYVSTGCEQLAKGYGRALVLYNGFLFNLTANASPAVGRCIADLEAFDFGDDRRTKVLEAFTAEGKTALFADITSDTGETRSLQGSMSGELRLRPPLRGKTFDIHIQMTSVARVSGFRSLTFRYREENA